MAATGMYEDLEESENSGDSIIYRENVLDKLDGEVDEKLPSKIVGLNELDLKKLENVSNETKELFNYVQDFIPKDIDLERKWKVFVPDYIASCGDLDAFLKVDKPGFEVIKLGLKVLDEPSRVQSDPAIIELQLKTLSKQPRTKSATLVKKLTGDKNLDKNIDKWIASINDLQLAKPSTSVQYKKPMPEVAEILKVR